ncbi:DUF2877 domain-containing protein [Egicoccus sp. AB-alg6-2]|uniref:DUF2877 domain-containing protein n=1 Tax=Egicoccus sp. AB-alg6-2 TaxID=3242692 RepID=UPI00359D1380
MSGSPAVVGASASDAIRRRVAGPTIRVEVLAAFPAAVYLAHTDGVLALVTADGVRHPNAIAIGAKVDDRPFAGIPVGGQGTVGDHHVRLPGFAAAVRRWWRPRPALPPVVPGVLGDTVSALQLLLATAAAPLPHELAVPRSRLHRALADGDRDAALGQADALLGLGPGLTPSGDDVLSGIFAAVSLLGPVVDGHDLAGLTGLVRQVGDASVQRASTRTTSISAALLAHAVAGEVSDAAADVFTALAGAAPMTPAVQRLLRVGATSGRDLGVGILTGARLIASVVVPAPPTSPVPEETR